MADGCISDGEDFSHHYRALRKHNASLVDHLQHVLPKIANDFYSKELIGRYELDKVISSSGKSNYDKALELMSSVLTKVEHNFQWYVVLKDILESSSLKYVAEEIENTRVLMMLSAETSPREYSNSPSLNCADADLSEKDLQSCEVYNTSHWDDKLGESKCDVEFSEKRSSCKELGESECVGEFSEEMPLCKELNESQCVGDFSAESDSAFQEEPSSFCSQDSLSQTCVQESYQSAFQGDTPVVTDSSPQEASDPGTSGSLTVGSESFVYTAHEECRKRLAFVEKEKEKAEAVTVEVQSDLKRVEANLKRAEADVKHLTTLKKKNDQKMEEQTQELFQARDELNNAKDLIEVLKREKEELIIKTTKLEDKLDELAEYARVENTQHQQEKSNMNENCVTHKEENSRLLDDLNSLKEELGKSKTREKESFARVEELESELARLQLENEEKMISPHLSPPCHAHALCATCSHTTWTFSRSLAGPSLSCWPSLHERQTTSWKWRN